LGKKRRGGRDREPIIRREKEEEAFSFLERREKKGAVLLERVAEVREKRTAEGASVK